MKDHFLTLIKGAAVGGTMLVPGVSGGTMAMMLGLYDRLIRAVSSFHRHVRANLVFLLWFCLGAGLGICLLAKPLLHLMQAFPLPCGFFFLGAVAGSVPTIYQKSSASSFEWRVPVYILLGVTLVLLLSWIPTASPAAADWSWPPLLLILAGIVAAVALVLPGISVSYLLLLLGLYDATIHALDSFDLTFLLPLAVGLIVGILSTAKLLEHLLTRYPRATYLIILGFMLASLPTLFPGWPQGWEWPVCALTFLSGFCVLARVSRL